MIAVVLGAKGGIGRETVLRLSARGPEEVAEIRAVVRNPAAIKESFFPSDERIRLVAGDVTSEQALEEVFNGATYAIFAAAGGASHNFDVEELGLKKTLIAAEKHGLKRVAICSSQLVDPVNGWSIVRILLNTYMWGMMDSKFRGENHVREICRSAKVEYSIVRPGRLIDGPIGGSGEIRLGQTNRHFLRGGASTRADVAEILVRSLTSDKARNATFEMAGLKGSSPLALEHDYFSEVKSDEARVVSSIQ